MSQRWAILRLAGLVLLACAINVAGCLLLAWMSPEGQWATPLGPEGMVRTRRPTWVVRVATCFGGTAVQRYVAPDDWPRGGAAAVPWWSEAWQPPSAREVVLEESTQGERYITEVAYGWPLRSMKYRYVWTTHPVGFSGRLYYFESMDGGLQLGRPGRGVGSAAWYGQLHALPLRPILSGFLLNVLMITAAIGLPAPLYLERLLRTLRTGLTNHWSIGHPYSKTARKTGPL